MTSVLTEGSTLGAILHEDEGRQGSTTIIVVEVDPQSRSITPTKMMQTDPGQGKKRQDFRFTRRISEHDLAAA
jgi:hypothetical protein